MKRILVGTVIILNLVACASGPHKDELQIKPSYSERVRGEGVSTYNAKASCPKNLDWMKERDWHLLIPLANACVQSQEWAVLEKIGNHLATQAHLTPWGAYYMGLVAMEQGNYPRAQWMLELALKKAPKEGILHYQLGRLQWANGDEAQAVTSFKQASDLNESLIEAHSICGQIALERGELSDARRYINKALAQKSNHVESMQTLVALEVKAGDFAKAEDLMVKVVSAQPRNMQARLALAQIQEQHLRKLPEALSTYREIKELSLEQKLDASVPFNLEDKIKNLEKSLSQVQKGRKVMSREPSTQKQVRK